MKSRFRLDCFTVAVLLWALFVLFFIVPFDKGLSDFERRDTFPVIIFGGGFAVLLLLKVVFGWILTALDNFGEPKE